MNETLEWIRLSLTPYLPPPVVVGMKSVDKYLDDRDITSEGSIRIALGCIVIWMIHQLVQFVFSKSTQYQFQSQSQSRSQSQSQSFMDLNENKVWNKKWDTNVNGTVILCGPSNSGKTVLFHRLCTGTGTPNQIAVPTVTSIQMNHKLLDNNICLMDYPGHPSLRSQFVDLVKGISSKLRIILVLDSTKPVSDAADLLYLLLTHSEFKWNQSQTKKEKLSLLIACNKSDLSLAKNAKRMKIQLRTELERLRKLYRLKMKSNMNHDNNNNNNNNQKQNSSIELGTTGKQLDLDNKYDDLSCQLQFISINCIDDWQTIIQFVNEI